MTTPKMYFTISKSNNVLTPMSWLAPALGKIYSDKKFLAEAGSEYNAYTRKFIEDNTATSSSIFSSNKYMYDASTKKFNFEEIKLCATNEDFADLYSGNSEFDASQDYDNMSEASKTVAKPKKEVKVETAEGPTLFSTIQSKYACPEIEDGFYVNRKNWNIIIRNILKHKNTLITGSTGCGKTSLVIKIAEMLNLPLHIYDMGQMIDPLTDLLGSHRLENGNSVFDYAKFVKEVQQPGIILLDELSRASALANNILFPCLDDRRMLPIEIADSKSERNIKIHPDCVFIATANIGDEYVGTNSIDLALDNRFITVNVSGMPVNSEIELLMIKKQINRESAENIMNIASKIRTAFEEGEVEKTVSTRDTLECAELIHDGFNIFDAIEYTFMEKMNKDDKSFVQKLMLGQ